MARFFFIFSFFLCTQSFADYYRVTAPNGLNVRASANKNGEVLGQLSQDNVIDVISIETDGLISIITAGKVMSVHPIWKP